MIMTDRDGVCRTEAFRGARACFHCLDCAIARRRVGHERIEQMLCGVSDIIDGPIEGRLVCLGRLRETAQLPDELKRRSANLVVRCRWTEVMKCLNGSAHVEMINNLEQRSTTSCFTPSPKGLNHQLREAITDHFAMQTFLGSVKKRNASSPPSRPTPLCFMPPKGTRRSRSSQQFTQTVPVLIRSATR